MSKKPDFGIDPKMKKVIDRVIFRIKLSRMRRKAIKKIRIFLHIDPKPRVDIMGNELPPIPYPDRTQKFKTTFIVFLAGISIGVVQYSVLIEKICIVASPLHAVAAGLVVAIIMSYIWYNYMECADKEIEDTDVDFVIDSLYMTTSNLTANKISSLGEFHKGMALSMLTSVVTGETSHVVNNLTHGAYDGTCLAEEDERLRNTPEALAEAELRRQEFLKLTSAEREAGITNIVIKEDKNGVPRRTTVTTQYNQVLTQSESEERDPTWIQNTLEEGGDCDDDGNDVVQASIANKHAPERNPFGSKDTRVLSSSKSLSGSKSLSSAGALSSKDEKARAIAKSRSNARNNPPSADACKAFGFEPGFGAVDCGTGYDDDRGYAVLPPSQGVSMLQRSEDEILNRKPSGIHYSDK